nr:hypothetical protein HmN_000430700 [Hymenolepis microstoma]
MIFNTQSVGGQSGKANCKDQPYKNPHKLANGVTNFTLSNLKCHPKTTIPWVFTTCKLLLVGDTSKFREEQTPKIKPPIRHRLLSTLRH